MRVCDYCHDTEVEENRPKIFGKDCCDDCGNVMLDEIWYRFGLKDKLDYIPKKPKMNLREIRNDT